MAILAIRGHATRGKEVIEILEMFGGDNFLGHDGREECFYYCFRDGKIKSLHYSALNTVSYCAFTLEQFFQKFPYKIGDKVKLGGDIIEITNFGWDMTFNEVLYVGISIVDKSRYGYMSVKQLRPYTEQKEESMEERENSVVVNNEQKQLKVHSLRHDRVQLIIDDKYELIQEGNSYYIVKKQPKYPNTCEECLKVLGKTINSLDNIKGYKFDVLMRLQQLLICRDAYWKIAGDWKPKWNDNKTDKYIITNFKNEIVKDLAFKAEKNSILAFPTEEMRDAFYENFKELIEEVKELL